MTDRKVTAAPDYTNAALIMLGVNLIWLFWVVWALWGVIPVLVLAAGLNHLIGRLALRRNRPRR
jgi:hypothetical protein